MQTINNNEHLEEKVVEDLPNEVLIEILQFLPFRTILSSILHLNKRFSEVGMSNILWKRIFHRIYHSLITDSGFNEKVSKIAQNNLESDSFTWKDFFLNFSRILSYSKVDGLNLNPEMKDGDRNLMEDPKYIYFATVNPKNPDETIMAIDGYGEDTLDDVQHQMESNVLILDKDLKKIQETKILGIKPIHIFLIANKFFLTFSEDDRSLILLDESFKIIKKVEGKKDKRSYFGGDCSPIEMVPGQLYISGNCSENRNHPSVLHIFRIDPETLLAKTWNVPLTKGKIYDLGKRFFKKVTNRHISVYNRSVRSIEIWDIYKKKMVGNYLTKVNNSFIDYESNGVDKILISVPPNVIVWSWKSKNTNTNTYITKAHKDSKVSGIIVLRRSHRYERTATEYVVMNYCESEKNNRRHSTTKFFCGYTLQKKIKTKKTKKEMVRRFAVYKLKPILKSKTKVSLQTPVKGGRMPRHEENEEDWIVSEEVNNGVVVVSSKNHLFIWNRQKSRVLRRVTAENAGRMCKYDFIEDVTRIIRLQNGRKVGTYIPSHHMNCFALEWCLDGDEKED